VTCVSLWVEEVVEPMVLVDCVPETLPDCCDVEVVLPGNVELEVVPDWLLVDGVLRSGVVDVVPAPMVPPDWLVLPPMLGEVDEAPPLVELVPLWPVVAVDPEG
jgi:hypothetical protein